MNIERWHRRLVETGPSALLEYLAYILFFPLAVIYGFLTKIRVALYRSGWLRSYRSPVPVISIGNLAVGGTGKTPVTDLLVKSLLKKKKTVAVVSRGYGRSGRAPLVVVSSGKGALVSATEGGDEPVLLARRNPQAIVIVSADRRRAIRHAVYECGADIILLDDGFQHLKVHRDLDIALLDARKPFTNGFPLPFGLLREFPSAIDRADLVLLTRSRGDEEFSFGDKTVLRINYKLSDKVTNLDGEQLELEKLKHGRIGAFAGIANPDSFFQSLESSGVTPIKTLVFSDHAVYGTSELTQLHGLASRCDALITTEKDLVKLGNAKLPCDCWSIPLELDVVEGLESLESVIDDTIMYHKEKLMLDQSLLDILACPKCKGDVEYSAKDEKINCNQCNLSYPIRDGIPVMLVDEAFEING
ncbi:MAG: tetraacyldisaccharide 4'-kinase [Desulfuromonas sp.]|nr:MAG: tetraacyldisaccharide 4'-kinase [Desulfuromonas sp.]